MNGEDNNWNQNSNGHSGQPPNTQHPGSNGSNQQQQSNQQPNQQYQQQPNQQYQQQPNQQYQQQPNPQYQQPQHQQPQQIPQRKSNAPTIVGIIAVAVVVIFVIWMVFSGGGGPLNPVTGKIDVQYDSVLGNSVEIYLDGDYLDTIPSDEYVTFSGIESGTHEISAYTTGGSFLDSDVITVTAGETTRVTLSYW